MAYNEQLADRVREIISASTDAIIEKKMFGGLCFMVRDKMCVGIRPDKIMIRIAPDLAEQVLESATGVEAMIHGGKKMRGFIYVDASELQTKKQLQYWIKMALEFNVNATPSKKK